MKTRIFTLIPFLFFSLGLFAQTTSGSLTADETWTTAMSPVHITGDVTVPTGITLTINPGVVVKFDSGKSLIVVGALRANGTSGTNNQVIFTAWGTTWGHISFNNSTGTSNLDYCIIEKGDATTASVKYGGGVHIKTNNVTINNCIFRNNKASHGGGVFLDKNSTTSISNSYFTANTAGDGGGFYAWSSTNGTLTNCLIYANSASNGKNIFLGDDANDVRVINSTIISSTSSSIRLALNTDPVTPSFINCAIWGSSAPVNYYGQTPKASDFTNCAIQDPVSGSTTNCVTLNASNSDPAGPNFLNPTSYNYKITTISPCYNAGTTSGAPAVDIRGYSRRGNPDIGAYESSLAWTGAVSTNWSTGSNWEGGSVPTTSDVTNNDIIIPSGLSNYPISGAPSTLTISSTDHLTVEPAAQITLNSLTNNGTLVLRSGTSGCASLIVSSFSGNNPTIELYLTGGGNVSPPTYKWHYISTPITSLPVSVFAPGTTLDLAQYVESRPTLTLSQGWVAFDGYVYSTGNTNGPTFSNLTPGKGYNFWDNANNTFTFSGQLNTGDVAASLSYTTGDNSLHGFNLIGNPFSSGLDWDQIINGTYFAYPLNTSKSLYFTRNNVQCSYVSGVGTPSDVTGIIPPMQGFFNKTHTSGNTITLPAAARVQGNIHSTYKGGTLIPLVRLAILEDSVSLDETVVRFDENAKVELDDDYDALKMFLDDRITSIYSITTGVKYAINGQPFPEFSAEYPVAVNVTTDSVKSISVMHVQGLDNYNVTLKDNVTGLTTNLKTVSIIPFTATAGTYTDRFILKISNILSGLEDISNPEKDFRIYPYGGVLNIIPLSDEWAGKSGSINVLDLAGRVVETISRTDFEKNSIRQIQSPSAKGIYLVEIRSGNLKHTGKVVIR